MNIPAQVQEQVREANEVRARQERARAARARAETRLERVQGRLARHDRARLKALVDACKAHYDLGDDRALFSTAVELARAARLGVLGLTELYPAEPRLGPGSVPPPLLAD